MSIIYCGSLIIVPWCDDSVQTKYFVVKGEDTASKKILGEDIFFGVFLQNDICPFLIAFFEFVSIFITTVPDSSLPPYQFSSSNLSSHFILFLPFVLPLLLLLKVLLLTICNLTHRLQSPPTCSNTWCCQLLQQPLLSYLSATLFSSSQNIFYPPRFLDILSTKRGYATLQRPTFTIAIVCQLPMCPR